MPEPNFAINFTARMLATEACEAGDLLVFDAAVGNWRVATAANRATAVAKSQAVALTDYGGSLVGKVSYQSSGVVAQELTGLPVGYGSDALVRTSSTGAFERIASYTTGDDVIGYAEPDGRVHLHFGLPWGLILGVAGGASLPDRSLQYRIPGGTFGGSTDVLISNDAAENLTIGNALGTPVATAGTIRGASGGVDHATGLEFYVRNGANDGNILALGVYNATGQGDVVTFGGYGNAALAPRLLTFFANNTFRMSLTTTTPQGSKTGVSLFDVNIAGPVVGWDHRRICAVERHSNLVVYGTRNSLATPDDALAGGEGVFHLGRSEFVTTLSPASGATFSVPSSDRVHYVKANGQKVPVWDGPQLVTSTTGTLADISTLDGSGLPARIHEFTAASTTTLGSLTDGREGRSVFIVSNPGEASFAIKHNSGGTAANRVLTPSGFDQTYDANEVVPAIYDTSASRWRIVGRNPWKVGGAGHDVSIAGASVAVTAEAGESFSVEVNGQRPILADENYVYLGKPISGDEGLGVPLRIRTATITFASANYTMAGDIEATAAFLTLTGTTAGARDLIAPNVAGSVFNILNSTADTITLKKSAGTGVTIVAGAKGWFIHNGTDYEARS